MLNEGDQESLQDILQNFFAQLWATRVGFGDLVYNRFVRAG